MAGLCAAVMVAVNGSTVSASPRDAIWVAVANNGAPLFKQGLSGSVRDELGKPVGGALVVPRSLQQPGPAIPELAVLTDDSGRYAWPLPPGPYELVVTAEAHEIARRRGSVTKGAITMLDVVVRRKR